jgi:Gti1/Pac2 family
MSFSGDYSGVNNSFFSTLVFPTPTIPTPRERAQLIKSGCVFIYEENGSGIKRWTDGVPWSPSRILGNFLVYRELMKPFPSGEKKRVKKKNRRPCHTRGLRMVIKIVGGLPAEGCCNLRAGVKRAVIILPRSICVSSFGRVTLPEVEVNGACGMVIWVGWNVLTKKT